MSPIRIIILAVLFYILWRLVRGGKGNSKKSASPPPVSDDVLVEDPVCHLYVPRRQAVRVRHHGKTLYFCSTTCRDRYRSSKGENP